MSGPVPPRRMAHPTVHGGRGAGCGPAPVAVASPVAEHPDEVGAVTEPVEALVDRAAAFARALPGDCAFSHGTAAALLGVPLPRRFEESTVLDVMRCTGTSVIRRKGCAGHRGLESRTVAEVLGCESCHWSTPGCDLGEWVARGLTVDDLVVAGDDVVNRLRPRPRTLDSQRVLGTRCRPRGGAALEAAASLVRSDVRSPMESRARLMFRTGPAFRSPSSTPSSGTRTAGGCSRVTSSGASSVWSGSTRGPTTPRSGVEVPTPRG